MNGRHYRLQRRREQLPWPPIIRVRSLSSNSVAGAASVPRLRNQDGIEKGISRLQLKLPTSISISAPIYSHRPYKRVCSYIEFPLSHIHRLTHTYTLSPSLPLFLYRLLILFRLFLYVLPSLFPSCSFLSSPRHFRFSDAHSFLYASVHERTYTHSSEYKRECLHEDVRLSRPKPHIRSRVL